MAKLFVSGAALPFVQADARAPLVPTQAPGHPMIFSHSPWLVVSVLCLAVVWLCLAAYFLRYARTRQPAVFSELGKPSFSRGSFRMIAYVLRRGHRSVEDPHFNRLCDAMLVCYVTMMGLALYAFVLNGSVPSLQSAP